MVRSGMDTRFVRLALGAGAALLLAGAAPDETRLALPSTPPRSQRAAGEVLFSDDFASGKLGAWAPDREGPRGEEGRERPTATGSREENQPWRALKRGFVLLMT